MAGFPSDLADLGAERTRKAWGVRFSGPIGPSWPIWGPIGPPRGVPGGAVFPTHGGNP